MKKILLLFVVVLVLCFTACSTQAGSKYPELEQMLDSGQYMQAINYIQGMLLNSEDVQPDEAPNLLEHLLGQWALVGSGECPTSLTFMEDGTCIEDGNQLQWVVDYISGTTLYVDIYKGDSVLHAICLETNQGEFYLQYLTPTGDGGYLGKGRYIQPSHYEIIHITQDNWQDYFELTEEAVFEKNTFGEVENVLLSYRFSLKQEYFDRLSQTTYDKNAAVEIQYTNGTYKATIDTVNETYTLGSYHVIGNLSPKVIDLGRYSKYYGMNYTTGDAFDQIKNGKTELHNCPTKQKILRLQATIYLLQDK